MGDMMMRKLIWPLIALGLAIWSLIAWFAYAVIRWGGNIVSSNADQIPVEPEAVELFSWLAVFGTDILQWLVVGVWAIGAVIALGLGFALNKMGRFRPEMKHRA
jgi:hypothetical protein